MSAISHKRDRYKRLIAVCYVGPFNINEQMVTVRVWQRVR